MSYNVQAKNQVSHIEKPNVIIFYVDDTGERGFVVATVDVNGGYQGFINENECYSLTHDFNILDENSPQLGSGLQNSIDIATFCGQSGASLALEFESQGYSDWYLPSLDELMEIFISIPQYFIVYGGDTRFLSSSIQEIQITENWWFIDSYRVTSEGDIIWGDADEKGYIRPIRSF